MPAEPAFARPQQVQTQTQRANSVIAGLAGRQHGVVARNQLLELELGREAIAGRVRDGLLNRLHPGVYVVGRREVSREGRWMAAVLVGGLGAAVSHRSAAGLWGISRDQRSRPVEIATPRSTRSAQGVRRHCERLGSHEVTVRNGIPVTTLRRTVVDLAAVVPVTALEAAVREAQYRHGVESDSLRRLLSEYRGRRGIARLRTCLDNLGLGPRGRTRSPLEDRFASLLARTDMAQPDLNALVEIGGQLIEADCLWAKERVIVELDGAGPHRTETAFQSDRARDRRLQALGWRVGRVTDEHLDEPEAVLADIQRMLEAGRA